MGLSFVRTAPSRWIFEGGRGTVEGRDQARTRASSLARILGQGISTMVRPWTARLWNVCWKREVKEELQKVAPREVMSRGLYSQWSSACTWMWQESDAAALASKDRYVIGCDIVPLAIQSANQRWRRRCAL